MRGCGLRLRLSVTGVILDILLGNANIKYDPDLHITDKNPTCLDWGHCFSFDPVYDGEAKSEGSLIFNVTFYDAITLCCGGRG